MKIWVVTAGWEDAYALEQHFYNSEESARAKYEKLRDEYGFLSLVDISHEEVLP